MRSFRYVAVIAAAMAVLSCSRSAKLEGLLSDAPESDIVVKLLDVNRFEVLDTVRTDSHGQYRYKVGMKEGQPEFIYLFYHDTRIASLLLQVGDRVKIASDTLGTYSVTGSDETLKLIEVERDEADFNDRFNSMSARLSDLDQNSEDAVRLRHDLTSMYVSYYRSRVKYILRNPYSLTSVPVLYQTFGAGVPVFSQTTDAIHFRNVCDSLRTVYPESRYVRALSDEAERRQRLMSIDARLRNAGQSGFPDMELPDVQGQKVKLSSLSSKVVMLYFWNPEDASQKIFNQDVMKPLYNDYHAKGFDIYSVAATSDKLMWASVVKNQGLTWTNVCDVTGSALSLYNVTALPNLFFIVDGSIAEAPGVRDEGTIRKFLSSKL